MRLFIAIPLAAATAHDLAAAIDSIRVKSPANLRWSAAESWHITLQFLGSTTPQQYNCVAAHLRELRHPPIAIEPGVIGTFDRAGVLFVDVSVTPELLALQQAVTAATAPCGFLPETRPYHPHITLARRKGRELRSIESHVEQQPNLSAFTASAFLLYESIPTPEGSRYEVREHFPLRK